MTNFYKLPVWWVRLPDNGSLGRNCEYRILSTSINMDNFNTVPGNQVQPSPLVYILLLLLGMAVGGLLGAGLVFWYSGQAGMEVQSLLGLGVMDFSREERNFFRWSNFIAHVCTFTLPPLALALIVQRRRWSQWLDLDRAPSLFWIGMGALFIAISFPLAQLTYWINRKLPLPKSVLAMEEEAEQLMSAVLQMDGPGEWILNLLVVGLAAAVGEELLFRGVIQKQLERAFTKPHLAIWVTAVAFSAIHMQFAGFLPRMVLGALLGYLFYWSRNLWVPIFAHLFFNGAQVTVQFLYGDAMEQLESDELENVPLLVATGLLSLALVWWMGRRLSTRSTRPPSDIS